MSVLIFTILFVAIVPFVFVEFNEAVMEFIAKVLKETNGR